jgi:hypothetical protein
MSDVNLADYRHPRIVRRTLEAMALIACPPEIEELGLAEAVVDHMELSMRTLPGMVRTGLVTGITTFETAARVWPGNWGRPFSKLSRDKAHKYFVSWRTGTGLQKQFIKGVKGLLCLGYYEMPAVKKQIDFQPEGWIEKVSKRRLKVYREDIEAHQARILAPDPLPPMSTLDELADDAAKKEAS